MTTAKVKQKPANSPQKGEIYNYRKGKDNEQVDDGLESQHVLSHLMFLPSL